MGPWFGIRPATSEETIISYGMYSGGSREVATGVATPFPLGWFLLKRGIVCHFGSSIPPTHTRSWVGKNPWVATGRRGMWPNFLNPPLYVSYVQYNFLSSIGSNTKWPSTEFKRWPSWIFDVNKQYGASTRAWHNSRLCFWLSEFASRIDLKALS